MAAKFGTSGLRGLSTELIGSVSALYASAFARYLLANDLAKAGGPIAVAQDFRDSSPEIASAVMGSLRREGLVPLDCGTIPTPALALYAMSHGAGAIMITGSHIPADRNGIKFYRPDGEIGKGDESEITALATALADDAVANSVDTRTGDDHSAAAANLFLKRNFSVLEPDALKGRKIGVYQHSTVARDMMMEVMRHYGAEAVALGRSDSFIPVDTEAVSAESEALMRQWALEHKLDAIISADGDGDRPLVADEAGRPLRGDLLGLITAQFLDAQVVVTPVTSNSGIEAAATFEVVRTKVGSPFVIAAMSEALEAGKSGVLGFEANGGLMLASAFSPGGRPLGPLPTRDCFMPALAVLATAVSRQVTLSALSAEFGLPVAVADRLENFANERSTALMAYLRGPSENLSNFLAPIGTVALTSDIDGLRVTLADQSVIHFRPSGNAPEMRCYVEARDAVLAENLLKKGLSVLSAWKPVN